MEIYRAHLDVMCGVMMLGIVVRQVGFTRGPLNGELALVNSVWDPMESHVHSLGLLKLVVTVGKTTGSGIIGGDDGGARLFVAYLLEDLSDKDCLLAIVK